MLTLARKCVEVLLKSECCIIILVVINGLIEPKYKFCVNAKTRSNINQALEAMIMVCDARSLNLCELRVREASKPPNAKLAPKKPSPVWLVRNMFLAT